MLLTDNLFGSWHGIFDVINPPDNCGFTLKLSPYLKGNDIEVQQHIIYFVNSFGNLVTSILSEFKIFEIHFNIAFRIS